MRHHHKRGSRRGAIELDDLGEKRGARHHWKRRGFGTREGRSFNYGEFRLLALAMIGEEPRHGYELMKAVEERMGGSYTPSPGVIYPTLSWLEDMGYTSVEADQAGRKRYRITREGQAFLAANRGPIDELLSRISKGSGGRFDGVPAPIVRGMENLKLALRLRMREEPFTQATVETIATALDSAAQAVERS
jgi:DNA-binding PadR family transcriptional regulator